MCTEEHFGQFVWRKIITCPEEVPGRFFCKKYMETFFGLRAKRFWLVFSNRYLRVHIINYNKVIINNRGKLKRVLVATFITFQSTVKLVIEGHGLLFFNLLARVAFYYRWPSITGWRSIFQPSIFGIFRSIKFEYHNYFKCFKSVETLGEMRIHSESRLLA